MGLNLAKCGSVKSFSSGEGFEHISNGYYPFFLPDTGVDFSWLFTMRTRWVSQRQNAQKYWAPTKT